MTTVHVWFVDLTAADPEAELEPLLSPVERARARRFVSPHPRSVFVRSHGILRRFLGAYTDQSPRSVRIETTEPGKPFLPDHSLAFNLSHSGQLAAYAFTRAGAVGIDIEAIRPRPRLQALARRALAPAEYQQWRDDGSGPAVVDFLRRWCRREAVAKATGDGVWASSSLAVLDRPDGTLGVRGPEGDWADWGVLDLDPPTGYVGALAMADPAPRVETRTAAAVGPSVLRYCRLP